MNPGLQLLLSGLMLGAPACAVAVLLRSGSGLRRWTLGLALGPLALGVVALPLRAAGGSAFQSGLASALAWTAIALAGMWLRRSSLPALSSEDRSVLRWVLPLVLLVALPPLLNPHLLTRSDAWFHAAVTAQVEHLPVPPQDPYYAGIRLQYFWFFHLVLSSLHAVAGMSPFHAMWGLNVSYFFALLVGSYALARTLGGTHSAARGAPFLVAFAANPLGWLWVPVHAWKAPGGWAEVGTHLPDYVLNLVTWRYSSSALGFSMDKFLVGTAFSWGMALFLWWCVVTAEHFRGGGVESALLCSLLLAGMMFSHSVAGFTAGLAGAAATFLSFVLKPSVLAFRRALWIAGAMALGLLLVYPYLNSVTSGKSSGGLPHLGLNREMLWTTFWVSLGLLPGAWVATRVLWSDPTAGRWTLLLCVTALALGCVVHLSFGNEGKFLHLAMLPLASIAAVGMSGWWEGSGRAARLRTVGLLALFVPTTALVWISVLSSRGEASLRPDPPAPSGDERAAYAWVREHAAPDAVLLVRPGSAQALVLAGRAQVWTESSYATNWEYPEELVAPRERAVRHAFGPGLQSEDVNFLRGLGHPVLRIARGGEVPAQTVFAQIHRAGTWLVEILHGPEGR